MKVLFIICCLCVLQTTAQQCFNLIYNTSQANYTGFNIPIANCVVLYNLASINWSTPPINTSIYPYTGYENFWMFNEYYQTSATYLGNVSSALISTFSNLTAASINTNSPTAMYVLQNSINMTIASLTGGNGPIPIFALNSMSNITYALLNQMYYFQNFVNNIVNLNLGLSPSNLLKMIPTSASVNSLVSNITTLVNYFVGNATNTMANITTVFAVLNSANSKLSALTDQRNVTIANLNQSHFQTILNINTTVSQFGNNLFFNATGLMNNLSPAVKADPTVQSVINSTVQVLNTFLNVTNDMKFQLTSILSSASQSQTQTMQDYYYNITQGYSFAAQQTMYNYMTSQTLNNCGAAFMANASAIFALNPASTMFNCPSYEVQLLPRINATIAVLFNNFMSDYNILYASLVNCTTLQYINSTYVPNNVMFANTISMCLDNAIQNVGTALQPEISYISSSMQNLVNILMQSSIQRMHACTLNNLRNLMTIYAPGFAVYQNCATTKSPYLG